MGKFIRVVSERARVVASEGLWLEDAALQQLAIASQLPGMRRAVGLPNLQAAHGYPAGAAFFSSGRFYPALCGAGIGCGVSLWQTGLAISQARVDLLSQQLHQAGDLRAAPEADELARLPALDAALPAELAALAQRLAQAGLARSWLRTLGAVGAGTHLLELQAAVQVDEPALYEGAGLLARQLQLVVRDGAQAVGQHVLEAHLAAHGHAGLAQGTPQAQAYLRQHDAVLAWARLHRKMIALRVALRLRCEAAPVLDVHYNQLSADCIDGEGGWLHRRDAYPTDQGPVLLPGLDGGHSYLIRPLPVADGVSLQSLAHGGRKDGVLDSMEGAGLVRVMAKSRPVLSYAAAG
jgi:release factor H-coupled RctB family protein